MNVLNHQENFLGLTDKQYFEYATSQCVIQQVPYEHTSSYKKGSKKGPRAILDSSHYVEFYDIELEQEIYKSCGIASIPAIYFSKKVDKDAMDLIEQTTNQYLKDDKFVVSLGAEHTVTYATFKAHLNKYPDLGILQLDAHSDLRETYEGNEWSHACVMARINELGVNIFQLGIRAQSIEEAELIKSSKNITTYYANDIWQNNKWVDELVEKLPKNLYITIDADGFDPSIAPSVGTPEPGGLEWNTTLHFLKKVFKKVNVVGFDIVEITPTEANNYTAYAMAQLCYKLIGYKYCL